MQNFICKSQKFPYKFKQFIDYIVSNDVNKIGFFCGFGKHRSVGIVELIKKNIFIKSDVYHHNIDLLNNKLNNILNGSNKTNDKDNKLEYNLDNREEILISDDGSDSLFI